MDFDELKSAPWWDEFMNYGLNNYVSYEDARAYVRSLKFECYRELREYAKSGKFPPHIPKSPITTYQGKGWISCDDYLGTGRIADQYKEFLTFKEARKYVHKLGLKSQREYFTWRKSPDRPNNIPVKPERTYKEEWVNWGDWLGTNSIAPQNRKKDLYLSFKKARKLVRSKKFKSYRQYQIWVQKESIENLPYDARVYDEFTTNGDWLGTNSIDPRKRVFLSFEEAREYIHSLGMKSLKEYKQWAKTKRPDFIPSSPYKKYKEWKGFPDWIGYKITQWRPYEEAKLFAQSLGAANQTDYRKVVKDIKNMPSTPQEIYKDEWENWYIFLGNRENGEWRPYEEAKAFVRTLGLKSMREYRKAVEDIKDIPSNPVQTYGEEWENWYIFLGKSKN
jgi:hypothetical protein